MRGQFCNVCKGNVWLPSAMYELFVCAHKDSDLGDETGEGVADTVHVTDKFYAHGLIKNDIW